MHVDVRWKLLDRSLIPKEQIYNEASSFPAIVATLVSIALLSFLLRVYTRTRLLHIFAIDDSLIVVSAFCVFGILITFTSLRRLGLEQKSQEVGPYLWTFSVLLVVGLVSVKLSVAFHLLRIIQRPRCRRILYTTIGILFPLAIVWTFTLIFQCAPVAAAWNRERRTGAHCMSRISYRNLGLVNTSINAATDLVSVVVPIPYVLGLRVRQRTKLSLMTILSLGFFACAAAVVRMPLIYNMWNQEDPFAHSASFCLWGVIEMTAGMTAACLPTLKPLLTSVSTFVSDITSRKKNRRKNSKNEPSDSPPPSPYPQSYSTPTFLSLPRPKPTRYHDHTSDLDFDVYGSPSTHNPTMKTGRHNRNASNMTTFSNFTNFTNFTAQFNGDSGTVDASEKEGGKENADGLIKVRTRSKCLSEMGVEVKDFKSGYAASVRSGETCDGSEGAKTVRRMASEGESVGCISEDSEECKSEVVESTITATPEENTKTAEAKVA